jgi:hypothetical protein
MMNRLFIATAFVASLTMQAPVLANDQALPEARVSGIVEASDHMNNNQEVVFHDEVDTRNEHAQQAEDFIAEIFTCPLALSIDRPELDESHICKPTTCSNCSSPFQTLMKRIAFGVAIYNITHGAITLANTAGPCIGQCAANVSSDFGWGAFQLLGALV